MSEDFTDCNMSILKGDAKELEDNCADTLSGGCP